MAKQSQEALGKLDSIDTSAVEELARLKKERDVLIERLELLDREKGKVSEAVYERIRADYEGQRSEVEATAQPLAETAKGEAEKLAALLETVEKAASESAMDKEELELRLKLGEFDEEEFRQRTKTIDRQLESHNRELTEISKTQELFASALEIDVTAQATPPPPLPDALAEPSTDEPSSAAAETPSAEALPLEEMEMAAGEEDGDAVAEQPVKTVPPETVPLEIIPPESAPPETAPAEEGGPPPPLEIVEEPAPAAETSVQAVGEAPEPEELVSEPPPAPLEPETGVAEPAPAGETLSAKTAMLPIARLKALDSWVGQSEILLGPMTTLGRTGDNDVQISEPAVSRKHAHIELADKGFVLRDLDSGNGTYVNGTAITEHVLAAGDRIQIGTTRFEFSA